MSYSIETLTRDVMARLGELPRPQQSLSEIPWPQDVIALKVRSRLPEVGSRLILGSRQLPNPATQQSADPTIRRMPCGLYAAEVALPEDFLRLASVKMGEWRHPVSEVLVPADSGWTRQWSEEAGIAGCPVRPRAYLDRSERGPVMRLMGSRSEEDTLEMLTFWRIPAPDAEGCFDFPAVLYPELVSVIAASF